jgi:ribosomal protein S12 methylthiotransferase
MRASRIKVAVLTLGCPKNQVDSEFLRERLSDCGLEPVCLENASLVILNTCAFIGSAEREAEEEIRELIQRKKRGQIRAIAVGGCLVERRGPALGSRFPEVDLFFRIDDVPRLPQILLGSESNRYRSGRSRATFFSERRTELETPGHYAYLKVAEGCNHRCSFCIIPQLRGRYRSREIESLIREARALAARGVVELILIAQDLTLYGNDLYGKPRLDELLRELSKVPDIRWIRLLYLNPQHLTEALLRTMAGLEKVVKYVELPVQHASDRILGRMRRAGGGATVRRAVSRVRSILPEAFIRTEVIVGFPGESEEDFEELLGFLDERKFERIGVFPYEDEEGARSQRLTGKIPEEVISERFDLAKTMADVLMREAQLSLISETMPVLVEGKRLGRTPYDAPEVDLSVLFDGTSGDQLTPGEIVRVRVLDVDGLDLRVAPVILPRGRSPSRAGRGTPKA